MKSGAIPCVVLLLLAGCSSPGTGTTGDAGTDVGPAPDGSTDSAAWDGGDVPGGPPDPYAAVHVVINGNARTFDGVSTWTKFLQADAHQAGFQTNAPGADATFVMGVFDGTPGANTCANGASISIYKGPLATPSASWGTSFTTATCTVNVTQYGPLKGNHVVGTFSAELDLSGGSSSVKHLSLTNGTFDLVQYADTPP